MDDYIIELDGGSDCVHKSAGKRSLGFDRNIEYTSKDDLLKLGQFSYNSDQHPDDLDDQTYVEHAPYIDVAANVEPVGVAEEQQNCLSYNLYSCVFGLSNE
ncbi:unnamed protein product [Linum trigynum]|uniref:Uncharacterized protein n=1 Tax=Linum trigynum TaxID=586398 RepID=A0AAV2F3I1_9ROSI